MEANRSPWGRLPDSPVAEAQAPGNDTDRPFPDQVSLSELIAQQAAAAPSRIAVSQGAAHLSYAELDRDANRLAQELVALGAGRGCVVAVATERDHTLPVILLGVLKSGAAYLPLDPGYPAQRLAYMLEDSGAAILVTQSSLLHLLPTAGRTVLALDRDADHIEARPAEPPFPAPGPADLAYIIYTSGSTGRPKGVEIEHRHLVNLLWGLREPLEMSADDVLVAVTSLSFDIAGLELYLPLLAGARVEIAPRSAQNDPRILAGLLDRAGATVVQATPATWRMLVDSGWQGRSGFRALAGGEAMPPLLAQAILELGVRLWNLYGPTETTIWSTMTELTTGAGISVGRPIANTRIYILGEDRQPLSAGAVGELWIGGAGVARGYHKRPDLTSERFLPDPFATRPGERMYRTGDLARHRADGAIDLVGRIDHQVKIRGYRIELGEIEAALLRHPAVKEAVAVTRNRGDELELIAYVVLKYPTVPAAAIRRSLRDQLPQHMIPASVVPLPHFPLTPNNKLDRGALPSPGARPPDDAGTVAPRTELEARLCAIWTRVLELPAIGVTDDFFDLGVSSLRAARLFAQVEREFGRGLPPGAVFQTPTIEGLARVLESGTTSPDRRGSSLVPLKPGGSQRPIFCVHGGAGTILHLAPLARALEPDQPFYGLQARGLYGGAPPHLSIEGMARHYLQEIRAVQPEGPYRLVGYCFGALVAYEMAQRLTALGERVELLVSLNGPTPAYILRHGTIGAMRSEQRKAAAPDRGGQPLLRRSIADVARTAFWVARKMRVPLWREFDTPHWFRGVQRGSAAIRRGARLAVSVVLRRPLSEHAREADSMMTRICARAEVRYRPRPWEGDLLVFSGGELYKEPTLGWARHVRGRVTSIGIPGHHHDQRAVMTETYATMLAEHLRRHLTQDS